MRYFIYYLFAFLLFLIYRGKIETKRNKKKSNNNNN